MNGDIVLAIMIYAEVALFILVVGLWKWVPRMHPKHKAVGYVFLHALVWPLTLYVALSEWYEGTW